MEEDEEDKKTRRRERGVKRGQRNCRRGEDKFSLRLRREIIYSLDTSDPVTPGITLWHRLGLWLKVLTGRDFSPRHSDLSGLHMSPHETWSSSETQEREQADSCVRRILFRNNWNVVYYFKSKYYRKTLFVQHQKAYKEIQNEIVPLCTGVRWLSNGTLLVSSDQPSYQETQYTHTDMFMLCL